MRKLFRLLALGGILWGLSVSGESVFRPNPAQARYSGLYDQLDKAESWQTYRRQKADFLARKIQEENPESPAWLVNFLLQAFAYLAPPWPEEINEIQDLEKFPGPLNQMGRAMIQYWRDNDRGAVRKKIEEIMPSMPRGSYTLLYAVILRSEIRVPEQNFDMEWEIIHSTLCELLENHSTEGFGSRFVMEQLRYKSSNQDWENYLEFCADWKDPDPWLLTMLKGHAAIARGWMARGDGYASTVSEEGFSTFHRELTAAKKAMLQAAALHPEYFEPHMELIYIEMGLCDKEKMLDAFREMVRRRPDFEEGYMDLMWGLLPRWHGSQRELRELALFSMTAPENTIIPAFGGDILACAAWDVSDYRWKNVYRNPQVMKSVDAVIAAKLRQCQDNPNAVKEQLLQRWLYELACLRYDEAVATVAEIGGQEVMFEAWNQYQWSFRSCTQWAFRMPKWEDSPPLFLLFTGPNGKQLRAMEVEFLDGDSAIACSTLKQWLMRHQELTPKERNALIDLYGRWKLQVPCGKLYCSCPQNHRPFFSYDVAENMGNREIMQELIEMGYDQALSHY